MHRDQERVDGPWRILFVCSRNEWRSPTAERVFGRDPRIVVRSGGTARSARRRVTIGDLHWADTVLVMERSHRSKLREQFPESRDLDVIVLDVPDDYGFMDPDLVELLEATVAPLIEVLAGGQTS